MKISLLSRLAAVGMIATLGTACNDNDIPVVNPNTGIGEHCRHASCNVSRSNFKLIIRIIHTPPLCMSPAFCEAIQED